MAIQTLQKFTKEELNKIEILQKELTTLTAQFGSLQISKIRLEKEENLLKLNLNSLMNQEKELAKSLTEKYGKGTLNPETGDFTPVK